MKKLLTLVLAAGISAAGVGLVAPAAHAATASSNYTAISPARVLDTRQGTAFGPGETRAVGVNTPAAATAVVINVTATQPTSGGFLTVFPPGTGVPLASNVDFTAGQTIANTVTVGVSHGVVDIFNALGTTQVLVDVQGYYTGPQASFITPTRVMDTRQGLAGAVFGPGEARNLALTAPAGATAVALNVTVTEPTKPGYLTVFPTGGAVPTASNLDFAPGDTVANMVMVGLGTNQQVTLFNSDGNTHVVVDVSGWFFDGSYVPNVPFRVLDTRQRPWCGGSEGPDGLVTKEFFGIKVPWVYRGGAFTDVAATTAVSVNITATNATGDGFISINTGPVVNTSTSNLNYSAGHTSSNASIVAVGGNDTIWISNYGANVDLVVDINGAFFTPPPGGAGPLVLGAASCHDPNRPAPPPPPAPPAAPTPPAAPAQKALHSGSYLVGSQIQPGTYQVDVRHGPSYDWSYWERDDANGGIIDNGFEFGPQVFKVSPGDWRVVIDGTATLIG